jgi:hypothetical protein
MMRRRPFLALLVLVLAGSGCKKAAVPPPASPQGLSITNASWGWPPGGTMADVTPILAKLVAKDTLATTATIAVLGDPSPEKPKRLLVEYSLDGVACRKTVEENEPLRIARGEPPAPLRLRIVKATYGDHRGGKIKDVTVQTAATISGNQLRITPSNLLFGDPAERQPKEFRVDYTWDGVAKTRTVKEYEALSLGGES